MGGCTYAHHKVWSSSPWAHLLCRDLSSSKWCAGNVRRFLDRYSAFPFSSIQISIFVLVLFHICHIMTLNSNECFSSEKRKEWYKCFSIVDKYPFWFLLPSMCNSEHYSYGRNWIFTLGGATRYILTYIITNISIKSHLIILILKQIIIKPKAECGIYSTEAREHCRRFMWSFANV